MRIYKKNQIQKWDTYTIQNEPINSIDLMERASQKFCTYFESFAYDRNRPIVILAGFGNNGGDALAIGRILATKDYKINILAIHLEKRLSPDCAINLERARTKKLNIEDYTSIKQLDNFTSDTIIIDGLFGSGLSRKLENEFASIVNNVNNKGLEVISIDIPSGIDADKGLIGPAIKAKRTLTFQCPKPAFLFEDLIEYFGTWEIIDIGLHEGFHKEENATFKVITRESLEGNLIIRKENGDKSDFGFGQLCGGSAGMLGALLLAGEASFRAGIGRLIITTLRKHHQTIFSKLPVSMVQFDETFNHSELSHFEKANSFVNAIACGPGMGTSPAAIQFIDQLLNYSLKNVILDADALNIISKQNWHNRLPENTIITPHFREFQRLFGKVGSHVEALELQIQKSIEFGIIIILKGKYTSISLPNGKMCFNVTGNVGMATAGSGDVLTGILLGLIAQGYSPFNASRIGVFIHGLSGDKAKEKYGVVSMTATDIIEFIPEVIKNLYET